MRLLVTSSQVEYHGLHLGFIAFVAILGVVLTAAAVVDATRHHRSPR